jgi:hypothetical protein
VRKTRHNSSLSDLGVATKLGHKVDWGKSVNLVNLFDIQNLQSHVLNIYIRHSKFWHLNILIRKLSQCLAPQSGTQSGSFWLWILLHIRRHSRSATHSMGISSTF